MVSFIQAHGFGGVLLLVRPRVGYVEISRDMDRNFWRVADQPFIQAHGFGGILLLVNQRHPGCLRIREPLPVGL